MGSPKKSNSYAPKPSVEIVDPLSSQTDRIYRNIETAPLIDKIKKLEIELEEFLGEESVEIDELDPKGKEKKDLPKPTTEAGEKEVMEKLLNDLLDCFNKLLKIPYGALGYMVGSDSESVVKLYGVDSDDDYYMKLDRSTVNVGSKRLEGMVAAGGGKNVFGIESNDIAIQDPMETPNNMKVANQLVNEIIQGIRDKLDEANEAE